MADVAYFDYVSADLFKEIVESLQADPEDFVCSPAAIDSDFKKFNLTDVILFQKSGQKSEHPIFRQLLEQSDSSIRYYKGIEVEADNENTLMALVRKERAKADFLTVRSDDEKVIRAAADSLDVDAVIPVSNKMQKPAAGKINHIVAKIAADKKTAFAFDMAPFLSVKGYRRSKLFSDVMEMIPILRKYNVPILLFSGAGTGYEMRGPYEFEALGRLFGMTQEETISAVGELPKQILSERRKRNAGVILSQGVEIISENGLKD